MPRLTNSVESAASTIRGGGIVAYPTETVYGVGALALKEKTVQKVIALKKMPSKPISIAVSSLEMINTVAYVYDDELLRKLLPGPFTVLLPKRAIVPQILTAGSIYVGVRLPAHEMARQLINEVGEPITSTSANLSGNPPATHAEDVALDVDCVLEGGTAPFGPSTVVDLTDHTVIRKGAGYEYIARAGLLRKSRHNR